METREQDKCPPSTITGFVDSPTVRTDKQLLSVHRSDGDRVDEKQELVALAISALRQADVATEQAFEATSKAQRDRIIFGTIGVLGVAVGLAGAVIGSNVGAAIVGDASTVKVLDGFRPRIEITQTPVTFADRLLADVPSPTLAVQPATEPAVMQAIYVRSLPVPPTATMITPPPSVRHTTFVPHVVPGPPMAPVPVAASPRHGAAYRFVHNIFH